MRLGECSGQALIGTRAFQAHARSRSICTDAWVEEGLELMAGTPFPAIFFCQGRIPYRIPNNISDKFQARGF